MNVRTERLGEMRSAAYSSEHSLAWVMALVAIVLVAIGLLRGFGLIGDDTLIAGVGQDSPLAPSSFWDGLLWMLPGVAAGFLASALHDNDHHRMVGLRMLNDADRSMYASEHGAAYLVALLTIAAGALALLVGFGIFDEDATQFDGLLWGFASIIGGVLTQTLHEVRHHQVAANEEYMVTRLQDRIPGFGGPGGPATAQERRAS